MCIARKATWNASIGDRESFAIEEAYSYNMGSRDKREVKKIVFEYFEFIENEWGKFRDEVRK